MALLVYSFLPVLASALVLPDSSMIHVFEHFEERSVVRQVASIPSYAIDYAPLVYLYSGETYFPSDIGAQLTNTQPDLNYTPIAGVPLPLTLDNLNSTLSSFHGSELYITSIVDPTTNPAYLNGVKPDSTGKTDGAVSCAIIVNDHSSDTSGFVDVFYMYFYAFNYGTFLSLTNDSDPSIIDPFPIGNHVGDWEHNMIRFVNGTPQAVWYSQHDNGEAFTYDCLEKEGLRPITYSANGSHANYAINGTHSHGIPDINLPVGPVIDNTDNGPLWDPTLSAYFYAYSAADATFTSLSPPLNSTFPNTTTPYPTNWLYFTGQWGDEQYNSTDLRQQYILNITATAEWVSGPTGPEDKQLNRTQVCPDNGDLCVVSDVLRD